MTKKPRASKTVKSMPKKKDVHSASMTDWPERCAQALDHLIAETVKECDAHGKALLIRAQAAIRAMNKGRD